jgi:fucose 4-O-acetylase-like acetyltransferase
VRVGRLRKPYIETMRGLACILLVAFHVVGVDSQEGLGVSEQSLMHQFDWFFLPLRMPLFAFISGYVFNSAIGNFADMEKRLLGKAHRLLLPLITVGTIYFVMRAQVYHIPLTRIWKLYFTAYEHFWYLKATFIVMAACLAMVMWFRGRTLPAAAACFIAGVGLYLLDWQLQPNWLAITKAFYLAPFFYLGQILRTANLEETLAENAKLRLAWLATAAGAIVLLGAARQAHAEIPGLAFGTQGLGMMLLSLSLCAGLFALRWEVGWLAWIGPYSYAIYLFHIFFTAGSRLLLKNVLGFDQLYPLAAIGLVLGVLGPILVQVVLMRQPLLAYTLLGQRIAPRAGAKPALAPNELAAKTAAPGSGLAAPAKLD